MGLARWSGLCVSLFLFLPAAPAFGDSRPTSGDASMLSGRTLGVGEVMLGAALGWPAFWGQVVLAPSSELNFGIRGGVLLGSPILGLGSGIGGDVAIPVRWHPWGSGMLDLSLWIEPRGAFGEGAIVGEEGTFADNFGYALQLEVGVVLGAHVSDSVTLILGAGGGAAFISVPDAVGQPDHIVGTMLGILGIEFLMRRDLMLFLEARGGYGLAPEFLFDGHEIIRASLGIAHLL